jgi:hypothetical protein
LNGFLKNPNSNLNQKQNLESSRLSTCGIFGPTSATKERKETKIVFKKIDEVVIVH